MLRKNARDFEQYFGLGAMGSILSHSNPAFGLQASLKTPQLVTRQVPERKIKNAIVYHKKNITYYKIVGYHLF